MTTHADKQVRALTMTETVPPAWLLAFWKEIDDKTFGKGFDCFTEDAICNLGVADWHGREQIRENLRAFIDTGFTALHKVVEYWDAGSLEGISRYGYDDPGRQKQTSSEAGDDALFLHGRERPQQGPSVVWCGRPHPILRQ